MQPRFAEVPCTLYLTVLIGNGGLAPHRAVCVDVCLRVMPVERASYRTLRRRTLSAQTQSSRPACGPSRPSQSRPDLHIGPAHSKTLGLGRPPGEPRHCRIALVDDGPMVNAALFLVYSYVLGPDRPGARDQVSSSS